MTKNIRFITGLLIFVWANVLFAEACTYNEAKLALEKGNQTRGLSLMKMAAKDGDKRAVQYIASLNGQQNPITNQLTMLTIESHNHLFEPK